MALFTSPGLPYRAPPLGGGHRGAGLSGSKQGQLCSAPPRPVLVLGWAQFLGSLTSRILVGFGMVGFGLILFGLVWLDMAGLGFGWFWLDFGVSWLDFGLIWLGFDTFHCFY